MSGQAFPAAKHRDPSDAVSCMVPRRSGATVHKLEIANAAVMQLAIREELNRSEEARCDHRLHGVPLVSSGRSSNEVGALFGEAATTVQRWVRRVEESGFAGLREGECAGRPRLLGDGSWLRVEADPRKPPDGFGSQANLWGGTVLSGHLRGALVRHQAGRQAVPAHVQAAGLSALPDFQWPNVRDLRAPTAASSPSGPAHRARAGQRPYHHARALRPLLRKHRRHLTRFFLPPYSPQLSTIERV